MDSAARMILWSLLCALMQTTTTCRTTTCRTRARARRSGVGPVSHVQVEHVAEDEVCGKCRPIEAHEAEVGRTALCYLHINAAEVLVNQRLQIASESLLVDWAFEQVPGQGFGRPTIVNVGGSSSAHICAKQRVYLQGRSRMGCSDSTTQQLVTFSESCQGHGLINAISQQPWRCHSGETTWRGE